MSDAAYIVRCQRCGVARKSYNDPRRGISVIECKRPCGNSHYDWTLVRVIEAAEVWPPEPPTESDIPLYVPPTRPSPPLSKEQPDAKQRQGDQEDDNGRDASPSPAHPSHELDKKWKEKVEFSSQGRGSVMRSRSTSDGKELVGKAGSPTAAVDGKGSKDKVDCLVQ